MPILLLGLVFAIGLFIYYVASNSINRQNPTTDEVEEDDNLKKEENVIFLPDDIEWMKEKYKRKK